MSAAQLKQLKELIGKIAVKSDVVQTWLKRLNSRGVLDGITTTCVAGEQADEGACCDDGDPDSEEQVDPNEGTIDADRPDDGDNEKGMDGSYRMPDGSLVQWDELDDCMPDPTWEQGYYYAGTYQVVTGTGNVVVNSGGKNAISISIQSQYPAYDINGNLIIFAGITITSSSGNVESGYYTSTILRPEGDLSYNKVITIQKNACGGSTADYCQLTEAPCTNADWPSDGKCQEALINGLFVPNPSDPDCAGQAPQDNQIMCEGEGAETRCIAYIPTKDGGHMRVEVDPVTRLPDTSKWIKTYDSDGAFTNESPYSSLNLRNNAYSENSVPGNWE